MLYYQIIDFSIILGLSITLGGLFGSFTTALIHRIPRGIPIAFGQKSSKGGAVDGTARSYCLHCGHQLSFLDLVPILSYLFLRGKCRHCGKAYGSSYFMVECACVLLALLCFSVFGLSAEALWAVMTLPILIALFVIDLQRYILPNKLVLALFCLGVFAQMDYQGIASGQWGSLIMFLDAVIYAAVAWLIGVIFTVILKKEALGFGDVKFYAAAGIWLGGMILPVFMILSGVLGMLHGGYMRVKHKKAIFPFGPSLIISMGICYIFKDMILLYFYG